jgi:hypothetical protein
MHRTESLISSDNIHNLIEFSQNWHLPLVKTYTIQYIHICIITQLTPMCNPTIIISRMYLPYRQYMVLTSQISVEIHILMPMLTITYTTASQFPTRMVHLSSTWLERSTDRGTPMFLDPSSTTTNNNIPSS